MTLCDDTFFQGENNDKKTTEAVVVEETENDKYKRARKLYSLRMENKIKTRLNQGQQTNSSSNEITSNSSQSHPNIDVHPASHPPRAEQQPVPSQPRQRRPHPEPENHRQGVQQQDQTQETRSLVYDIVIAVVIVIIALLLYRRLALVSEVASPPAN